MTLQTWWLFLAAVFLLCGTPGPNMLHVMVRSIHFGLRRGVCAMAGCLSGVLLILLASAAGLSTMMLASPALFGAFRYGGVAYLVYLGVKVWRGGDEPPAVENGTGPAALSTARIFLGGLVIGVSNPKMLLFTAAFLPQFINMSEPQLPQYAVLAATFAVVEGFWYMVYGLGGRQLAGCLLRPNVKKAFNRITGGIFIGFGLTLLRVEP